MSTKPKPHPRELRDDVVAVARKAEASIVQFGKDFGISESRLRDVTRRIRLLEQENEVLTPPSACAGTWSHHNKPAGWVYLLPTPEAV